MFAPQRHAGFRRDDDALFPDEKRGAVAVNREAFLRGGEDDFVDVWRLHGSQSWQ